LRRRKKKCFEESKTASNSQPENAIQLLRKAKHLLLFFDEKKTLKKNIVKKIQRQDEKADFKPVS
jgi:hypothetical protein